MATLTYLPETAATPLSVSRSYGRLRLAFWICALLAAAVGAWVMRNTMSNDGISYLDMAAAVAQGRVQDRAALGAVDVRAGEHLVAPAGDVGLLGEREQEPHRLVGGAVLRVVDEQAARALRHAREALGVAREQLAQVNRRDRGLVIAKRLPRG